MFVPFCCYCLCSFATNKEMKSVFSGRLIKKGIINGYKSTKTLKKVVSKRIKKTEYQKQRRPKSCTLRGIFTRHGYIYGEALKTQQRAFLMPLRQFSLRKTAKIWLKNAKKRWRIAENHFCDRMDKSDNIRYVVPNKIVLNKKAVAKPQSTFAVLQQLLVSGKTIYASAVVTSTIFASGALFWTDARPFLRAASVG